jgi:hypothetical protein
MHDNASIDVIALALAAVPIIGVPLAMETSRRLARAAEAERSVIRGGFIALLILSAISWQIVSKASGGESKQALIAVLIAFFIAAALFLRRMGSLRPLIKAAERRATRLRSAIPKPALPIDGRVFSEDPLRVLDGDAAPPETLDVMELTKDGVKVRIVSVLHGLTGGTDRSYVAAAERTIAGLGCRTLGEKATKAIYRGIDEEVDDWIAIPAKNALGLGFVFLVKPWRLAWTAAAAIRERLSHSGRFGTGAPGRLQDIGGSTAFHLMDPYLRRRLAGFPHPGEYLRIDLHRRLGRGALGWTPPRFPDPDWRWLRWIEPHACIPTRSIHMLTYAVERAKAAGESEIAIVCGEIHGTDMTWFAAEWTPEPFDHEERREIANVVEKAKKRAGAKTSGKIGIDFGRAGFIALSVIGSQIGLAPWLIAAILLR